MGAPKEKVGTVGTVKNYKFDPASKEHVKNYKFGVDMSNDKKTIGVTETGYRVGENHQRANLTDEEVEMMRDLYEEGVLGYRALARAFRCSRNTVKCIVKYRRRNATAMGQKTVCIKDGDKR